MMGHRQVEQAALSYEFSLEKHVPSDHLLRSIERFVELNQVRRELAGFYSHIGRPSIDPELMIRMLIVGYCFGIRSERRLCEEVHLNLAYRWFCRLGLDGQVPDHSTFSGTVASGAGRATSSAAYSRRSCAAVSASGWSAAKASRSTPA
jgi:transposase